MSSTGLLGNDGFVVVTLRSTNSPIRWNPSTGEHSKNLKASTYPSIYKLFFGAGLHTQLLSLEMRILTPTFESLSPTHTIIRSFYDAPAILPYDDLRKRIDDNSHGKAANACNKCLWTAGPVKCTVFKEWSISYRIEWKGGRMDYCNVMPILPEIYEGGIILHIIPTSNPSTHRYATVAIVPKIIDKTPPTTIPHTCADTHE